VDVADRVEVELALTHDGAHRAKAVFLASARVSLGSSEQATLRVEGPDLPAAHEFLEVVGDGARLLLRPGMELQLILDEERKSFDELKSDGLVTEDGDLSAVSLPLGSTAVLTLGTVSVTMKCGPASDPATHVDGAGSSPLICGVCGSDLSFVVRHVLALSTCPRCQTRNRTTAEPSAQPRPGSLGPEGTESDVPLSELISSFDSDESREEGEGQDGPTDQGVPVESPAAPPHFEEEATQPSLSVRGSDLRRGEEERAERKKQELEERADVEELPAGEEVEAEAALPKKRRRKKRRVAPLWTPPLIALAVVGLVAGGIGLGLIFYAVLTG